MFVEGNWSQARQKKMHKGKTVGRIIADAAIADAGDVPFAWSENEKIQYSLPGTRIPNNCLGLNEFDHINVIISLRAANPAPAFLSFLMENFDLTKEQIYRAIPGHPVRESLSDCVPVLH